MSETSVEYFVATIGFEPSPPPDTAAARERTVETFRLGLAALTNPESDNRRLAIAAQAIFELTQAGMLALDSTEVPSQDLDMVPLQPRTGGRVFADRIILPSDFHEKVARDPEWGLAEISYISELARVAMCGLKLTAEGPYKTLDDIKTLAVARAYAMTDEVDSMLESKRLANPTYGQLPRGFDYLIDDFSFGNLGFGSVPEELSDSQTRILGLLEANALHPLRPIRELAKLVRILHEYSGIPPSTTARTLQAIGSPVSLHAVTPQWVDLRARVEPSDRSRGVYVHHIATDSHNLADIARWQGDANRAANIEQLDYAGDLIMPE